MYKKIKANLLFVALSFFVSSFCYGTDSIASKNYTYSVGGFITKGFVLLHDKKMGYLVQSHPDGFSFFFKKHTFGSRDWEKLLNYPDIGFSLNYFDYHNPILGKTLSAQSLIDFYLLRRENRSLNLQYGFGFCYSSSPYDRESNNKNIAIGSTLSYAFNTQLHYNHEILDRLKLIAGFRISHYSNGAFKKPNKGINIVTADIGLSYLLNAEKPAFEHFTQLPAVERDIRYNFFLSTGLREIDPVGSRKYSFLTLSFYASKQVSRTSAFSLGIDGFYSMATRQERETDDNLEGKKPDFKRAGVTGGYEFYMGKMSFIAQLGAYVYRPYKSDKPVYQRYGLKYQLPKDIYAGLFLKTHYGKAEAVEWSLGIKI